jgi:hypothetical protein
MRSRARSFLRLVLASAALLIVGPVTRSAGPVASSGAVAPDAASAQAVYRPEVRLRKLHLVRPDLILYPLAYEVYC